MKASTIGPAKSGGIGTGAMAAPAPPSVRAETAATAKPSAHDPTRLAYLLYLAANIGPRLATLILLVVLTRVLPTEEYGLFALVVTAGEILDMASTGWIRLYMLRTEGGAATLRPRRLGRALGLNLGATSFALVAAAFVVPLISREHEGDLLAAALAYVVAFALLRLTLTLAQLARCHGSYTMVESLRALGVICVTAATALMHEQSFIAVSLAISATTAVSAVIGLAVVTRYVPRPVFPRRGYMEPLAFGLPFVLAATLIYMIGWSDRFILNYFIGQASVAIYVAAYSIARQPVDFFIIALNNFTFPMLMRAYATGGRGKAGPMQTGILMTVCIIGLAMVAALSLLAEPLATVLFPPAYRADVVLLMPWIAIGTFLLSLKQFVFDNSMHVTRQTWLHLVSMLPPAAISLAVGILLIHEYGLVGAASNYIIVSIAAVATSIVISTRILPFAIPCRNIAKVVLAAAIASAVTWDAREHAAAFGPLAALLAGSGAFALVYAGVLTLSGISLRRLLETPWSPTA